MSDIIDQSVSVSGELISNVTEDTKKEATVPSGYIAIELSTKGRVYAPKKFHVRNFTAEDMMAVAFTDDETLPVKVIEMIQKLVYEPDVKIADFHEEEVKETLFILYKTFYSAKLENVRYIATEKDLEWLANEHGGKESAKYRELERDLQNERWKPTFNIDLNTIKTHELPEKFSTLARVKKPSGFTCAYSMPKYGDALVLRDFVNKFYKEKDKRFESIARTLKFQQDMQERWAAGENIDIRSIPQIPQAEQEKYNEYQIEKSIFATVALRALHLEEYKGQNVKNLPIEQKFDMAKDPELDYGTFKKINDAFEKVKIGLDDNIRILNPITQEVGEYQYSFRLFTILQALRDNDPDGVVIEFE